MEKQKKETLSIRVPAELKNDFIELFNRSDIETKSELFQELLNKYKEKKNENEKTSEIKGAEQENNTIIFEVENKEDVDQVIIEKPGVDTVQKNETDKEPEPNEENNSTGMEINISLNPVQAFAIRETVLKDGFVEEINKVVHRVDNGIDKSFFGNAVFSGAFKGVFSKMDKNDNEESIAKNMGIALVNYFMSAIVIGTGDLNTPVTRSMIKEFITTNENE